MSGRSLCVIMGGGRGTRMYPLNKYRSKPAVPLGGKYRLIDVPISNCLNSGYGKIVVLTQYNSQSLNKHVTRTYRFDTFSQGFVEIMAASQTYDSTEWFQGTADSVRQSLQHMDDPSVDEVIVLSGDQLFMMDLRLLHKFHADHGADITVACHPVPLQDVHRFGIMDLDEDERVSFFLEKPKDPALIHQAPMKIKGVDHYLANMGIYIFKKDVLIKILTSSDKHDFGKEIIPDSIKTHKVFAYTFNDYWSDVGTIGSYYEANIQLTDTNPQFNLYDENWHVFTRHRHLAPAKLIDCQIKQSIVAEGCIIDEAVIERSVVGLRSIIGKKTRITESMLAGNDFYESKEKQVKGRPPLGIGSNCEIKKSILDKNIFIGNNVKILNQSGMQEAEGNGYTIRDGIVVIHKNAVIPDGTTI